MAGWKEISEFVLKYDYCCGCGICAGICPQNALKLEFNDYGEFKPHLIGNCIECGLCLKICPFMNGSPNEDDIGRAIFSNIKGIHHTPETGYYIDNYVGYVNEPNLRLSSASGGLLTWTLTTLLEQKSIDYAVCVKPCNTKNKLFEFMICNSVSDVKKCSKSCYYPVELSNVISKIIEQPGRYAVVGLPCVLKALRKYEQINAKFKEKMLYYFGLVCGQQKSTFFSEYICAKSGANPEDIKSISFRVKDTNRPASDYGLGFELCSRTNVKNNSVTYWTEGMKEVWCKGYFKLNACNYCDDLFAECGDAVFMDAWLPEYIKDPMGTNIVLIRNQELNDLFISGSESNKIHIKPIDIKDVIKSQKGALKDKRDGLAKRLAILQRQNIPLPQKRVNPEAKLSLNDKLAIKLEQAYIYASKQGFKVQKKVGKGLWLFRLYMKIRLSILIPLNRMAHYVGVFNRRLINYRDK